RLQRLLSVIQPRLQRFDGAKALIHDICSNEEKEVAGRFAVMVWMLWNNRNNWIWNNEKSDVAQLGLQAFHFWTDWYAAQNIQPGIANVNQVMQQQTWQPPREGWLKCNVDAGFNSSRGTTNRGWCIRDGNGRFVCAGTAWNHGIHDSTEAEALALKEAVQIAIHI
ncbi:hypothetical protein L195_g047403, partial [Trifolium pratense]